MMSTLARTTRTLVRVLPQTCRSVNFTTLSSRTAKQQFTLPNFRTTNNTNNNNNTILTLAQRRFRSSYGTGVAAEAEVVSRAPAKGKLMLALAAGAGIGLLGVAGASLSTFKPDAVMASVWPESVRIRVRDTFASLGLGIAATAASSALFYRLGLATRIAAMGWPGIILSFGTTIATMYFTRTLPTDHPLKLVAWTAFNASIGLTLTPVALLGGALVLRAAAMTAGIVGSLSLVAANAPSDQFLWMAGPLSMGLGVVVISSLGAAIFPAAAAAPLLMNVSLYGGLAIFSGFVLFDTQHIIAKAKSPMPYDPIGECISLYMDAVNIFIRMVQILSMSGNNRK